MHLLWYCPLVNRFWSDVFLIFHVFLIYSVYTAYTVFIAKSHSLLKNGVPCCPCYMQVGHHLAYMAFWIRDKLLTLTLDWH